MCAFAWEPHTIVLISEDGSFLTARFNGPGECERISYARFLRGGGGSDDDEQGDGEGISRRRGDAGGGGAGGGGAVLGSLGQPSSAHTPTTLTRRPSGECGERESLVGFRAV